MKMMKLLSFAFIAYSALATPDCYDFTVTKLKKDYMEIVPLMAYYNHVDWLTLEANSNCAFYTYGNVFFKSYSEDLSAIYFTFYKADD